MRSRELSLSARQHRGARQLPVAPPYRGSGQGATPRARTGARGADDVTIELVGVGRSARTADVGRRVRHARGGSLTLAPAQAGARAGRRGRAGGAAVHRVAGARCAPAQRSGEHKGAESDAGGAGLPGGWMQRSASPKIFAGVARVKVMGSLRSGGSHVAQSAHKALRAAAHTWGEQWAVSSGRCRGSRRHRRPPQAPMLWGSCGAMLRDGRCCWRRGVGPLVLHAHDRVHAAGSQGCQLDFVIKMVAGQAVDAHLHRDSMLPARKRCAAGEQRLARLSAGRHQPRWRAQRAARRGAP